MNTGSTRGGVSTPLLLLLLIGAIGAGIWYAFFRDGAATETDIPLTAPLERGAMRVTISEAGSLEALDSHSVINKVDGRTTIDYIIPEGTVLTDADVAKGTVLVRLNTSDIEEKRIRQEIEVAAALDAHANAQTNLEIQIQQNASDLRKAGLTVHFARLDLKRYVGEPFAERLLASYAASIQPASTNGGTNGGTNGADEKPPAGSDDEVGLASQGLRRLISSLLDSQGLDGEALQRIRELTSEIILAEEEHGRALEKRDQSAKLLEKGHVSEQEFVNDKLALKRWQIAEERARTDRDQFVDYDFPKQVAKLLSEVVESEDSILRVRKKAAAAEAQKRSALVAKEKQKELKVRRLEDFVCQEKDCVLLATVPGLVVYASSGNEHRWGNQERISEGATVRQGQALITIPSPRSLGARISVHETFVDRVEVGQSAWITVDAMPGVRLPAVVKSVARLPNPADRWLNPDLKVYTTILEFTEEQAALKPGMSADVEILISRLIDVLAAPAQAVAGTVEKPAVYVWTSDGPQRRDVKLGLASEHFVEIQEGLAEGDRLLLDPPRERRAAPAASRDKPEGAAQGGPSKGGKSGKKGRSRPKGSAGKAGRPKGGGAQGKKDWSRYGKGRAGTKKSGAKQHGGSEKKGRSESR